MNAIEYYEKERKKERLLHCFVLYSNTLLIESFILHPTSFEDEDPIDIICLIGLSMTKAYNTYAASI